MDFSDYKIVWAEDFDYQGPVDSSKWNYETGNHQWPNGELQAYTNNIKNVNVADGHLTIRSLKEQDGDRGYTSGKVNTQGKAMWQYGLFDVRAKFPEGAGSWPAIWLMPYRKPLPIPEGLPLRFDGKPDFQNFTKEDWARFPVPDEKDKWPNCGEIDLIEHIGRRPNCALFSLHSKNHNHRRQDTESYTKLVEFDDNFFKEYHNYTMLWTEDFIEFFVDGESCCKYNKTDDKEDQGHDSWPFDKPYYLILNTAVGGGLGGDVDDSTLPFEFEVEYIHVFQKQ